MTGEEFFAENLGGKERCEGVARIGQPEVLNWENAKVSPVSPGPVTNDEFLLRQVLAPAHYDEETHEYSTSAWSDAARFGMSVQREKWVDARKAIELGEERLKGNAKQKLHGVARCQCGTIRAIMCEKGTHRGYCILDTAEENNKYHADIFQLITNSKDLSYRSIRSKLQSAMALVPDARAS